MIYTEEVDEVLRRHETALRALYSTACALDRSNHSFANKCISYLKWKGFIKAFDLVDLDLR